MRRIISVCVVAIVVLTATLFWYEPADACHGGCYQPCNGCYLEGTPAAGATGQNARVRGGASGAISLQGTPEATPAPEELCDLGTEVFEGATAKLLGFAHREPEGPPIPLCEFQILLEPGFTFPGGSSNSLVETGEATVFHVHQGVIMFELDDPEGVTGPNFLRVLPAGTANEELSDLDEPAADGTRLAEFEDTFTLDVGASIYLDNQPNTVALLYTHVDGDPAELRIYSAPPEEGGQE
jgi:hypothetical protein